MDKHSLETIELEMAILIRRVTSVTTYKKAGNLDRSAYLLLHQLTSSGSAGVKSLADEFHLDISTVSRQAAALEQKGYIYRIPDPSDRRACSFQITEAGKKVLNEYKQTRLARVSMLFEDWSDEDCRQFGQMLKKFNRTFI